MSISREVAVGEGPGRVFEVGEPVPQRVELRVDDLVGDRRRRDLDPEPQVVLQLDHRADLDDRVELDVAALPRPR